MLGSVLLQAAGTAHESFLQFLGENLELFLTYTGVYNATPGHLIMILVGLLFIFLAIKYEFEPMLLIPIGFGILIGNIPFKDAGLQVGIYEQGSVLNILYQGVTSGWYPPLIFLGIGAMTDFSALISNPKLMLIGAAAQFGIFGAYIIALQMGFEPNQAGAIGIIGGADGQGIDVVALAGEQAGHLTQNAGGVFHQHRKRVPGSFVHGSSLLSVNPAGSPCWAFRRAPWDAPFRRYRWRIRSGWLCRRRGPFGKRPQSLRCC